MPYKILLAEDDPRLRDELKILHLLFTHAGAFVPREDLIEYLWENHIFLDHKAQGQVKVRSA